MPDIVVHNSMGDEVLAGLDRDISALIDRDIFGVAVLGPDPYIFYRFFALPFRNGVNKRSHVMHHTKTGDFLIELAKKSRSREMFSYLTGFICHYALDFVSHPFINEMAEFRRDMHTAIEHRLDVMELEKQGKKVRDLYTLFTKYQALPEVREAMKTVYGWDDDLYAAAYRHMKLYHWIIKDQHGVLNFFLHWIPGDLSALSYQTDRADSLDLTPFHELERKAIQMAVRSVTAAYRFCIHEITEDELSLAFDFNDIVGGKVVG